MDATLAATLGGAIGLILGAVAVVATRYSEWQLTKVPPQQEPVLPRGVNDVLSVLKSIGIVVDTSDAVVSASPSAIAYGLVRQGDLVHGELRDLARQVRRDGVIREAELELTRGAGPAVTYMGARVAPLGVAHILILADDQTGARRVEEVRRDFVANVSHELKTPVGGISLLAEAILDAKDDPEGVERFAQRIQVESARLTRLVQEIVDLSRLQVADTLHEPVLVDVGAGLAEVVDRVRVSADARGIRLETAVEPGLAVYGDADLLTTAIANLVTNAVNYSEGGTRVAVAARAHGDRVEITVTDQGHGIPEAEQQRIFERFYRVDPARSRATGGTGLGLAIVKHVCATHGGDVQVWSKPGDGSTFTMRLPLAHGIRPDASTPVPEAALDLHHPAPPAPTRGDLPV